MDDGICVHGIIGKRQEMEDEHVIMTGSRFSIYGMFDGHGGSEAAVYCKNHLAGLIMGRCKAIKGPVNLAIMQKLIQGAFLDLEMGMYRKLGRQMENTGSTAVIVVVVNRTQEIFVANLGDSRAIIFNINGDILYETIDHKPNDAQERRRIEKTGYVTNQNGDVPRVNGVLAMSRAFGDSSLKMVSGQYDPIDGPVTIMPTIGQCKRKRDDELCLMLACDGVWDVMTSKQAINKYLQTTKGRQTLEVNGCRSVVASAYEFGSSDNISTMVVNI